jgi:hypothetical protein
MEDETKDQVGDLPPPQSSRKSSAVRTKRGSRVSIAPATDTSVVSYYHSNYGLDPPTTSSRKSVRLSLAQKRDTFVSIYKPEEEPEGDPEKGGEGRQFMFEYGKDNPVQKKEEPSGEQKWRAILQKLIHYKVMKFIQVCCAIYIAVYTLAPIGGLRPRGGLIIDTDSEERTRRGVFLLGGNLRAIICANRVQLVFIGITRISAYMMYPGKYAPPVTSTVDILDARI